MAHDTSTLTVPSRPEYAHAVRMTAAALVGRTGLGYDEVDDVRIAAEEAFVYACDHAEDDSQITLRFVMTDDAFEIVVPLSGCSTVPDEDAERRAAYATFILQSVCDRFELASDDDGAYLRVVKNLPAGSEDADG